MFKTVISAGALHSLVSSVFNPANINMDYILPTPPIIPSVYTYQDINHDRNLKAQVVNYYYDKVLNNWLKYRFVELYKYVAVVGSNASLIKKVSDAETNPKGNDEAKYQFLAKNYFKKNDLLALLSKFRKMNNLNWWDLKKYNEEVKLFLEHKVKQYIKREIAN